MIYIKNSLKDLNNYLFEELERLFDDENMEGDNHKKEIERAKAVSMISAGIIDNAQTILNARKLAVQEGLDTNDILMIGE